MYIRVNLDGVKEIASNLDPKIMIRATTKALNDTIAEIKKMGNKKIREKYALKSGDINKEISIRKANYITQSASLEIISADRTSFKRFNASQTKKGVTFRILKEGKRSLLGGAFILEKLGGHVFKRVGEKRFPIFKMMADIDVAGLFKSSFLSEPIEKETQIIFDEKFEKAWKRYSRIEFVK